MDPTTEYLEDLEALRRGTISQDDLVQRRDDEPYDEKSEWGVGVLGPQ